MSVVIIPVLCFLLPLVGVRLALFFFFKGFCIVEAFGPERKAWHGPSSDGGPFGSWF